MRSVMPFALLLARFVTAQESPYKNYAPVFSPDGTWVAFYSTAYGNFDLFTVSANGDGTHRLTDDPAYDGEPSWSPDGKRLVFVSNRDGDDELFLINADGSGLHQLTHNEHRDDYPAWSPASGRIVYRSELEGESRLFEIDPEDGATRLLSEHAGDGRLRWSADGSQLVFAVEHQDGTAFLRLDADGNASMAPLVLPDLPGAGNPQVSPDGRLVLFDAHSEARTESGDGLWELWTLDMETRELTRLTTNAVDDWGASWSRDGSRIVYAGGGRDNRGYEIFVMNADGSKPKQLTRQGEL